MAHPYDQDVEFEPDGSPYTRTAIRTWIDAVEDAANGPLDISACDHDDLLDLVIFANEAGESMAREQGLI